MRLALMFEQCPFCGVPGISLHPRAVIDRKTGVIADIRAGAALDRIFVHLLAPAANQVGLCESVRRQGRQ